MIIKRKRNKLLHQANILSSSISNQRRYLVKNKFNHIIATDSSIFVFWVFDQSLIELFADQSAQWTTPT